MDFELKPIIEFLGEQNVSSVQEIQKNFILQKDKLNIELKKLMINLLKVEV